MSTPNVQRSSRKLTPAETARLRDVRQQVEAEKDEIVEQAKEAFAAHERAIADTIDELRALRETLGVTIEEIAGRLQLDIADVQRLEEKQSNPHLATLLKYTEALGKRLVVSVEDAA